MRHESEILGEMDEYNSRLKELADNLDELVDMYGAGREYQRKTAEVSREVSVINTMLKDLEIERSLLQHRKMPKLHLVTPIAFR